MKAGGEGVRWGAEELRKGGRSYRSRIGVGMDIELSGKE